MKTTQKIMSLILAAGISVTGLSYGDSNQLEQNNPITIGNVTLERSYLVNEDDTTFIPIKVVAEALGYQVKWFQEDRHVELIKGARFITIKTTENYFTFSKMAPIKLSSPAFIKDGTTYVPTDFVSEILGGGVYENEGKIEIYSEISDKVSTGGFVITSIEDQKIYTTLNGGEAHILLNKETLIKDHADHQILTLDDLKVGDTLKITHPSIMLMIYPPQYNAYEIERINDVAYSEGYIQSINEDSILVKTNNNLVQFNIDESTVITGMMDNPIELSELRIGNNVKIYHSIAMMESLPPQSPAYEIQVDSAIK